MKKQKQAEINAFYEMYKKEKGDKMKTRTELLKARQEQCEWKQTQGCPITEFEKCSKCKAIHTKPLGLDSLIEGGWEGIQKKQQGGRK